jgi:hypothetical protein
MDTKEVSMSKNSAWFNPHLAKISKRRDLTLLLPNFESAVTVRKRKKALEAHLRARHGDYLADRLASCRSGRRNERRCLSGCCPVCLRAFRRWFFQATKAVADNVGRGSYAGHCVATVVPANLKVPPGRLSKVDLLKLRATVWRSLEKADLPGPVIGGVDVSYNEDAQKLVPPHWQVHIAFAVLGVDNDKAARSAVTDAITAAFDLEPSAATPVKVKRLSKPAKQISYLLKALFFRRVSIIDRRVHRNTLPNPPPLKRRQLVELSKWLDSHAMTDRLILHGARRGGLKIVADLQI